MNIDNNSEDIKMNSDSQHASKRRVFGYAEVVFDLIYLTSALAIGLYLLAMFDSSVSRLAALAAFVLVGGDAFHLVPRIASVITADSKRYQRALGIGKCVASITMTGFYVILWFVLLRFINSPNIFLFTSIYITCAVIRVLLCLPKQNQWLAVEQPVDWGIYRNIPFFLMGLMVVGLCFINSGVASLVWIGCAVLLSFLFYLPVVLWVNKNRIIGMLMLPKSLAYLWILLLLVSLVR